jgi:hypothetical protein
MGDRLPHAARSFGGRKRVAQVLIAVRRMTPEQALDWCDRWEEHAARSGLSSESAYFWDSARGWIDAQLDLTSTENRRSRSSSAQAS